MVNSFVIDIFLVILGVDNFFWVKDDFKNVESDLKIVFGVKIWGIFYIFLVFKNFDVRV